MSPDAVRTQMETPSTNIRVKRVPGITLPNVAAIKGPYDQELPSSYASGGSTYGGSMRYTPLAAGVNATTADAAEAVLRGQAPADPLAAMSVMSTMFNYNDYLVIDRNPTFESIPLDTFNIGTAMFIRKPISAHQRTSVWDKTSKRMKGYDTRTRFLMSGKKKTGQDVMMTLPMLNSILYRSQTKIPQKRTDKNGKKVEMKLADYLKQKSLDPVTITDQWDFDGFVQSQMQGANNRGKVYDSSVGMTLINTVGGMAYKVANFWGDDVKEDGQYLFWLIKGIPLKNPTFRTNADARNVTHPMINRLDASMGKVFVDVPIQVIPWTHSEKKWPTMEDLEYVDDFGRKKYGVYIPVGYVQNVPPTDDGNFASTAIHDAASMIRLPPMSIMINAQLRLIDLF